MDTELREHGRQIADLRQSDARREEQLANIDEKLDDLKSGLAAINANLTKLNNTVLIDNGKPSVISRLNALEQTNTIKQRATTNYRWLITTGITLLVGLATTITALVMK